MAYNVLKGNVDGSVDQHADQEIGGIKVFKNTISASVFYDTDAGSPCATLKDVALRTIVGDIPNSVLVLGREGMAMASPHLSYDDGELTVDTVCAGSLYGDAANLTNIPADRFSEPLSAAQLKLGEGLKNVAGAVTLKTSAGLLTDKKGLRVQVDPHGGLSLQTNALEIDASKLQSIKRAGQSVGDSDLLIVGDSATKATYSVKLKDLYQDYLSLKVPRPKGIQGSLQLKGKGALEGSENLTYNTAGNVLTVGGTIKTGKAEVNEDLICRGAVHTKIETVTGAIYGVKENDYTLLCDTTKNKIVVTLPPAAVSSGRVIVIKNISRSRASQKTSAVVIEAENDSIDLKTRTEIRTRGGVKTLQSDGKNWWTL